jgi:hypothetical protein
VPIVAPLVALDVLVLVLWLIAVALAIALIMDKLAAILHAVPIAGGYLSDKVHDMARAITNAAGKLEGGIDHLIGAAWHQLARYTDKLWSELVAHSTALVQLAQLVGHLVHSVHGLRALVRTLQHVGHGVTAAVKTLEKEYHGIEHRVKKLEREIGQGIGHDLRIRIKALEKEYDGLENQVIPSIRSGIKTAEGEVADLEKWLGVNLDSTQAEWLAGFAAAALAALGLSGLNCNSNPFKNNRNACGLWGDLSDILGLLAATLAVLDFEQLVREMQALEEVTVTGLHDALNMV